MYTLHKIFGEKYKTNKNGQVNMKSTEKSSIKKVHGCHMSNGPIGKKIQHSLAAV